MRCFCHKYSDRQTCANSVVPDRAQQNTASYLGRHCLPLIQYFFIIIIVIIIIIIIIIIYFRQRWKV